MRLNVIMYLYKKFGITVDVNDGKVSKVNFFE